MKKLIYLLFVTLLFSCEFNNNKNGSTPEETTVYYFIRHAEKDRSDPNNKDPKLTDSGYKRAKHWEEIFANIPFDKIYSTDYNRTKQTVFYISKLKNIPIEIYDPKENYNEAFKTNTSGKTVLVVGHSNTTPEFVNAVIGEDKYPYIEDSNNGNLYIVTLNGSIKSVQLLTINY